MPTITAKSLYDLMKNVCHRLHDGPPMRFFIKVGHDNYSYNCLPEDHREIRDKLNYFECVIEVHALDNKNWYTVFRRDLKVDNTIVSMNMIHSNFVLDVIEQFMHCGTLFGLQKLTNKL